MQNNGNKRDNKTEEEQPTTNVSGQEETKPLFLEKEIRAIVKDFTLAYITGQIKLNFRTATEIVNESKMKNEKIDYKMACETEIKHKVYFRDLVSICAGTKRATLEQQQLAFNELFEWIMAFRNGGRIEGSFTEYASEERIRKIEEGLDKVNNLVKEIIDWIYGSVVEK